MTVRPIRNEGDYERSIARVESLMEAAPGSSEADELEVLATLIEKYEEKRYFVAAPTPLGAIRFRMEQANLSPRELEPFIGTRARVSEVLSGARPLSVDMIRALSQHLGIPAEALIQHQPSGGNKALPELAKPAAKSLVARGLLGAQETLEMFLSRALGGASAIAFLRKTRTARTNAKTDMLAVQAWCAGALLLSERKIVTGRFDARRIGLGVVRELAKLSTFRDGPERAIAELSRLGIAVVTLPHLPGTHLDGAAMRRRDGTPVIALTLRRDRVDNFWFTLLHELAHVKSHLDANTDVILDDLEISSGEQIEAHADRMAQEALMPPELWLTFDSGAYASLAAVQDLARRAGVHPAIVAGRWQSQNRDFRKFSRLLGHGDIRRRFAEYAGE